MCQFLHKKKYIFLYCDVSLCSEFQTHIFTTVIYFSFQLIFHMEQNIILKTLYTTSSIKSKTIFQIITFKYKINIHICKCQYWKFNMKIYIAEIKIN